MTATVQQLWTSCLKDTRASRSKHHTQHGIRSFVKAWEGRPSVGAHVPCPLEPAHDILATTIEPRGLCANGLLTQTEARRRTQRECETGAGGPLHSPRHRKSMCKAHKYTQERIVEQGLA